MNQTNTLAQDVEITGVISFLENLTIEGKVEGEITSPGALTVGENAFIKGNIKTRSVVIWGKVEGNITVQERCEAKASATIIGDISAGTFSAAEGATFLGRSRVGKVATQATPAA